MSIVSFSFNGNDLEIQCTKDEKLKDIISRFQLKSNIIKDKVCFLYGGNRINMELSFYEQANKLDLERNKMNILVIANKEETTQEGLIKSRDIICPQCKQKCLIDIKNYKIKLYDCKNNHENKDILLNEFDNKQKINENEIVCKNDNKTKYQSYNRLFYICMECKINLCPLCKENHNKEHEIIDYNDINYICLEHSDYYISFCKDCKINLCMNCEQKHNDKHQIIDYTKIIPEENIKEELKEFRKKIDKLNIIIRDITNILNVVSENMEIYYKITYDIAYNYNKKKKNYEVLKNVSSIRDFINISEINDILGNNINYKKKFDILMNIYTKMNNIKVTEEIKSDKKNDNNEIKNKKKRVVILKKYKK